MIRKLKLGLFVSIGMALFIIAVYYIGNKQSLFGETFTLSSTFKNVNGLQTGNNVRFSGINVGTVRTIVIVSDTVIRVDMAIKEDVRPYIKKDAIATISSDGLVGNMLVNIIPGDGRQLSVASNDVIESYSRQGAEDMLNTLNTTNENMALLTTDLLEITQSIINGKGVLGTLLYDSTIAVDLRKAVANLHRSSEQSVTLIRTLNETVNGLNDGDGLAGVLLRDTVISDQIRKVSADLEKAGVRISKATTEIEKILSALNSTQGVAGTLVYDSLMASDLKQTMKNINHGSELFNENMLALRKNFFFRKYFKKKEKTRNSQ